MTSEDTSAWRQITPARQAVAASASSACWSVERDQWSTLCPGLPAEAAVLLAPPIVVSVLPAPPVTTGRGTPTGLATQVTLTTTSRRGARGTRAERSASVRPATRASAATRQRRAVPVG